MELLHPPYAADSQGRLIDGRGLIAATSADDTTSMTAVATALNSAGPHELLVKACRIGLRLGEIAVRLGIDMSEADTDEIVANHNDLQVIRAALRAAGEKVEG